MADTERDRHHLLHRSNRRLLFVLAALLLLFVCCFIGFILAARRNTPQADNVTTVAIIDTATGTTAPPPSETPTQATITVTVSATPEPATDTPTPSSPTAATSTTSETVTDTPTPSTPTSATDEQIITITPTITASAIPPTFTPTPALSDEVIPNQPDFLACPPGSTQLKFNGKLGYAAMISTGDNSQRTPITIAAASTVLVGGYAKEGHPEDSCKDGSTCKSYENQDKEEFAVFLEGPQGRYALGQHRDKGLYRHGWFRFESGSWKETPLLAPGAYTLAVDHVHYGEKGIGAQSVDYMLSVCVVPAGTPTPKP